MEKEIPGIFMNDPKMVPTDLAQIEILSEVRCVQLWTQFVSVKHRHFMLLEKDEWPARIVSGKASFYQWTDDWNADDFSEFARRLQGLGISKNSKLYVFWMRERGLCTTWDVFCRNWGNFLYEDEGCILFGPTHTHAMVLSNGSAWVGVRDVQL